MTLQIRTAHRLHGAMLVFRNADLADAEFILSLRTDAARSKYLSATPKDVMTQKQWLAAYRAGAGQAYFIIERQGEPLGTVRLYDARGDSFCWGSWILKDGAPRTAALESALMVYAYGIDHLGFRTAHFDVRKGNERVWQFHERFGAQRISETPEDYLYTLSWDAIQESRKRYQKFLPAGVLVEEKSGIE